MNHHPARLSASGYTGLNPIFLTICTHARAPFFVDGAAVGLVLSHVLRTARDRRFAVFAYCFMPDHIHALLAPGAMSDARHFPVLVKALKQATAYHFNRERHRKLWQASFFDRSLRDDEDVMQVIQYIVANPVRAGIVESPHRYPYWGSAVYTREAILASIDVGRT